MALSEIVAKIKELQVFANENVEEGPVETLSGRRGRKNQAIDQLARLTRQYKAEMLQGAIFIVVTGAGKDAFSAAAVEGFNCFNADPEAFYADLSKRVPAALYLGKETLSNTFEVVGRHLEDKMMELGVNEYPQLVFRQQYRRHLQDSEGFTDLLKQAINEQVGSEIVGIQAVSNLVAPAIESGHSGKITPIILATDDLVFVQSLSNDLERISRRVFTVVAGKTNKANKALSNALFVKEATPEAVGEALKTINQQLKR